MVINTVDNHKVHAARSFGKRRRKLTVELGDVGETDRVSGKRQKHSVPFSTIRRDQRTAITVRRVNSFKVVKMFMKSGRIAAKKLPNTHMSSLKDTKRVFS